MGKKNEKVFSVEYLEVDFSCECILGEKYGIFKDEKAAKEKFAEEVKLFKEEYAEKLITGSILEEDEYLFCCEFSNKKCYISIDEINFY